MARKRQIAFLVMDAFLVRLYLLTVFSLNKRRKSHKPNKSLYRIQVICYNLKRKMVVSVHQPQYLAWIGYFHKIAKSDVFVFLDNVQYKKREFQNRNKIRVKEGSLWLTVPVATKDNYFQKLKDVKIDDSSRWRAKHWQSIQQHYSKAKYFLEYKEFFNELYSKEWTYLMELNVQIILYLLKCFKLTQPIRYENEFSISSTSTNRIIDICNALNADTYLSGSGGKNYMDEDLFKKKGIKLIYQEFKHPVYPQVYEEFEPNLSAIDLLFNCGEKSKKYLN